MYNDTQQINHEGNKMKLSILNLAPVREGQTYLQAVGVYGKSCKTC